MTEPAPGLAPAAGTDPGEEPLDLTEEMLVAPAAPPTAEPPAAPPSPPAAPATPAPASPAPVSLAPAAAPAPPLHETRGPAPAVPAAPDPSLLAPAAAAAAAASVGSLLRAVASDRSSPVSRGGPSIEDVVREEIRPLLKDWLDRHLPPMVERLVRAEIERVVGQALS
ncbi:DUF2497 domain-containing protein [Roseicella frigidaeris]|uniref:DUF2497 domain-containing protein n=1 Tax=Roseicella frigidaeris TaxID=2230885 RepID=UPI001A9FB3FF|nr:DUF2497 domain-containing protein [Roseicella frigidaeris]